MLIATIGQNTLEGLFPLNLLKSDKIGIQRGDMARQQCIGTRGAKHAPTTGQRRPAGQFRIGSGLGLASFHRLHGGQGLIGKPGHIEGRQAQLHRLQR